MDFITIFEASADTTAVVSTTEVPVYVANVFRVTDAEILPPDKFDQLDQAAEDYVRQISRAATASN